jgi:hypothetical protein
MIIKLNEKPIAEDFQKLLNREDREKSYSLIELPKKLEVGIYFTAGENKLLKLNGETK